MSFWDGSFFNSSVPDLNEEPPVEYSYGTIDLNAEPNEFMSEEALVGWVKSRAVDNCYIVVKRRTKKSKTTGSVIKVWLMCDRGGEHNSIAILRRSGSKKIGFPFQLIGLYNEVRESWKLQVINDNHNHEPAQNLEGHPYVRRFTQEEEDLVENLTERHMDPRNILSSIKKHNPANVSVPRDVYNLQQKLKNKKKFGDTPMQVLENVLHSQRKRFDLALTQLSCGKCSLAAKRFAPLNIGCLVVVVECAAPVGGNGGQRHSHCWCGVHLQCIGISFFRITV
ncbi:hypothetical protein E3N88_38306 [Mikania micrantha]|uniref:Protein FAR1-RELATED SEQUENCE n=1 Tax=Mikania micrantha TaxID=192012 RepID=A0A5N6LTP0_9ASTR|nr:hypothetical protein E3N88_38306 [Mikania micrantha]